MSKSLTHEWDFILKIGSLLFWDHNHVKIGASRLGYVLLGFLLLSENAMTKSRVGKKELISAYNSQITPHPREKSGQKLKAGMRRQELMETVEGCSLLPYLSWFVQPAFLYTSGPPVRGSTFLNVLDPAYSSLVRICPTGSSLGQSYTSMFSIVAVSFQILALFKLTNNKQTNRTPNLDRVGAIQPVVTLQERMPRCKETQAPGRTRPQLPSYKPGEAKDSSPTPSEGKASKEHGTAETSLCALGENTFPLFYRHLLWRL